MGIWNWLTRGRFDAVDAFVRYVARERPQWRVGGVKSGWLLIELSEDNPAELSVDRIRIAAGKGPENGKECQEIFRQFVSILDEAARKPVPLTLEADSARLWPRIVSDSSHNQLKQRLTPVSRRIHELGLWVVYAVDSEYSVSFLSEKQLAQLGIDEEQLYAIALKNLAKDRFGEIVRAVHGGNKAVNCKSGDSYDAARLLLIPDCLEDGQAIAACIPDRDTLIICPEPKNEQGWATLAKVAKIPDSDHLIVDRPIRVTRKGFELM